MQRIAVRVVNRRRRRMIVFIIVSLVIAVGVWLVTRSGRAVEANESTLPGIPQTTSRQGLDATLASNRKKVAADPGDAAAAVLLADALMRAARVDADAALSIEAERVLQATLQHSPSDYAARRMLSVVYLSQHRFTDALKSATATQKLRPADAWNYAIAGDALLELGRYEEAFDSFDKVMERRPDSGAYARVAYARELQGDLDGAVRLMRMSAEATSPNDAEALAWTYAQIGNLLLLQGRVDEAERELQRAEFTFPLHPYAMNGRIRLFIARHQYASALELAERMPATPELLATRGDLLARLGRGDDAAQMYRDAERQEREGWKHEEPQPAALARLLAERRRSIPEAIDLAERAARDRQDINTMDALAWAYFQAGRLDDAASAIGRATRLGTVDPRIRCHASAIATARAGRTSRPAVTCDPLDLGTRPTLPPSSPRNSP